MAGERINTRGIRMTNSNLSLSLSPSSLKKGWQIVKFGEIAKNISKRVNPSETDLEVYVGLEHLDPRSLRITRHGVPSDVKGQKLRVRPGQIIFGKRRAYQKKVAVADFDGICSAHAMVLEAVPGKIIPELLPFFMQSDMFMDRAIAISEGSLSPTIKWKTLAIQEFPLPPLERQKKILEVLEKVEESELKIDNLLNSAFKLMNSSMRYLFNPQKDWRTTKLHEVGDIVTGKTPPKKDSSNWNGTYLWATAEDFNGKYINDTKLKLTTKGAQLSKIVPKSSVLVTCIASIGLNAIANKEMSTNQQINTIIPNEKYDSEFIYYLMNFKTSLLKQMSGQTAVPIINKTTFSNLEFSLPPLGVQIVIADKLSAIDKGIVSLQLKLKVTKSLKKRLLSRFLNGGVE